MAPDFFMDSADPFHSPLLGLVTVITQLPLLHNIMPIFVYINAKTVSGKIYHKMNETVTQTRSLK